MMLCPDEDRVDRATMVGQNDGRPVVWKWTTAIGSPMKEKRRVDFFDRVNKPQPQPARFVFHLPSDTHERDHGIDGQRGNGGDFSVDEHGQSSRMPAS